MRITGILSIASAVIISVFSTVAHAEEGWIDEARFGGSILDIPTFERLTYYEYDRAGANVELLFKEVNINYIGLDWEHPFLQELLNPRPHIGATIALEDNTTSSIYAGLTWHHTITDMLFFETSFGAAVHDGELTTGAITRRISHRGLGSPLLFRESVGVGAKITENMNVIVQVSHMSHAGLAGGENAGQTDLAFKVGFKF